MTNSGGVIADMFNKTQRGVAMGLFVMAPFLGPALGKWQLDDVVLSHFCLCTLAETC
jgi:MFS family permease